ncbi:MAG: AAA family ATPase, partial [Proteobacteria bacterium]|nr:AAA family ATPase [Pseudomonadota bacterium]
MPAILAGPPGELVGRQLARIEQAAQIEPGTGRAGLQRRTGGAAQQVVMRGPGPASRIADATIEQQQLLRSPFPRQLGAGAKLHQRIAGALEDAARAISKRLAEIFGERDEIDERYGDPNSILAAWETADRFAAEVRSQERAHTGAAASLDRRREEHEAAESAVAQARERLYVALNPKGLRRVFKRDPGPPQLALRDSERSLRLASTSLASATGRELQARHSLEADRLKERELEPGVPKDEALRLVAERDSQRSILDRREQSLREEAGLAVGELNSRDMELTRERQELGEKIKEIAESVVRDAQLIATTLTKAATDTALSGRRFDTVVVDEASMAPLPLVYLAALLAQKRVVLVGDFRQLPPIVQSTDA